MIDQSALLLRIANEIQNDGISWNLVCRQLEGVNSDFGRSYSQLLSFLGCRSHQYLYNTVEEVLTRCGPEREAAARLVLCKFDFHTGDPTWSSLLLDRAFSAFLAVPGASVVDILKAVSGMSREMKFQLGTSTASFISYFAITCVTRHMDQIDGTKLAWLEADVRSASPAQAYLGLYVIPPSLLRAESIIGILDALKRTEYWCEAVRELQDNLRDPGVNSDLQSWIQYAELTVDQLAQLRGYIGSL